MFRGLSKYAKRIKLTYAPQNAERQRKKEKYEYFYRTGKVDEQQNRIKYLQFAADTADRSDHHEDCGSFSEKSAESVKAGRSTAYFYSQYRKVLLWILLTVTILSHLGVSTTAFLTVLGACGAAVALALKDSLSNFAGGILIIVNKPFVKGDYIESCGIGEKWIKSIFSILRW